MKTKIILLTVAAAGLLMASCNKEPEIESAGVEAANSASFSETLFDDVFSTLDIATLYVEKIAASKIETDTCPLIIVDVPQGATWPRTLTIDYGTACTGLDGVVRSGKIIITVTGPRAETGSSRSVTFVDYYFNGIRVEGTKTVENLGKSTSDNVVMGITLTGGKITLADNHTITCESSRQREYIAGFGTYSFWDDECLITGTASGTGYNGKNYECTITTPLHWKAVCRFIVSGSIEFNVDGIEPFFLDYGIGECDNIAVLSRDDQTKEIRLGLH